jgi:hypothetical protein
LDIRITVWGGMREHEGQPVLEAGASVYRLGPRCRTQARCTTYEWLLILLELVIGGCEVEGRGCAAYRGGGGGGEGAPRDCHGQALSGDKSSELNQQMGGGAD